MPINFQVYVEHCQITADNNVSYNKGNKQQQQQTRTPSLEVAPTTSAKFLVNHELLAGCYFHFPTFVCILATAS